MRYRVALAAFAGFLLGTYAAGFGLSGWLCLGSVAVATGALFITSIHRPAIYVLAFCLSAWIGLLYFNAFVAERILATQIPVDAANLTGVVLLGPPGSGRSTQSLIIAKRYGLVHICTRTLLKDEISRNPTIGQVIASCLDNGTLVPDSIVLPLVEQRLK